MDDLISRKALLAEYDRVHIGPPGGARKLIEDAPAVQKWIPVTEGNPKKPGEYWAVKRRYGGGDISIKARWNGCDWLEDHKEICVTYWMELPEPPEEDFYEA